MSEDNLEKQLNLEVEMMSTNQLTNLGNQAQGMGLIAGHGFRAGKYEILRQGEFLLLTPMEAKKYLENLIKEITG
ncbi:hypothetical protein V2H45_12505 [Tumidithrix elongata RA019]|uniref:Uncharacterized protein n=1 Tax=Tumidithrix elongata BACA0141 TaxID=2716417 RepID=A0AAW9PSW3_9CYAN|nr:hypothetical protein [Tumidithrix elongata RA019]